MSNKYRVPPPTCRGGYQPAVGADAPGGPQAIPDPPPPPTTGSNAARPASSLPLEGKVACPIPREGKTDEVSSPAPLSTDYLLQALSEQMETNAKLVKIVTDLTHRLEQATTIIDGLNHTIISLSKGESST